MAVKKYITCTDAHEHLTVKVDGGWYGFPGNWRTKSLIRPVRIGRGHDAISGHPRLWALPPQQSAEGRARNGPGRKPGHHQSSAASSHRRAGGGIDGGELMTDNSTESRWNDRRVCTFFGTDICEQR